MNIMYFWSKLLRKIRGSSIRNSFIHRKSKVESGTLFLNSFMDKYSFCGYDCIIINTKIGKFCSIANCVKVGQAEHPYNWVSTSPVFYKGRDSISTKFSTFERPVDKETIIGNDVWIGENCIIKQGVKVGHGSIIGMGSIVTKDVEPYSIVGGNPAKIIRMRFEQEKIDELLISEWWNLSDSSINEKAVNIQDIDKFIRSLNK